MTETARAETLMHGARVVTGYGGGAMANLKRVLWHLLGGTRGGPLRIRILRELRDRPYNTNQLATNLGVDYKTVQHHIRVLKQNRIIDEQGTGQYGSVFFLSKDMETSLAEFDRIAARVERPNPPSAHSSSNSGESP